MNNEWNLPEGYAERPTPVRYRIRSASGIVERVTGQALDPITRRWHHALSPEDHEMSLQIRAFIQQACGYFYAPEDAYKPLDGVAGVVISDDEVKERIRRLDLGENTREAVRTGSQRYPFADLPWDQQRALIEQVEAIRQSFEFEILGEVARVEDPPDLTAAGNYIGAEYA
jgi:hypothetical protein